MVTAHFKKYSRTAQQTNCSGFSIVELMIVILIIGVLMALIGPAGFRWYKMAQRNATVSNLNTLAQAINTFHAELGAYPKQLEDLVERPTGPIGKKWQEPYLAKSKIPVDGWGNSFVYKVTPGGKHAYDLYSYGPHGEEAPQEEYLSAWEV